MKVITWNKEKNIWLKKCRNIGFEDVLYYINNDCIVDDIEHPNQERYSNQRMFVIDINAYVYLVPYVESTDEIFLKTIIPSWKATSDYSGENHE